jgi:hypothetical protein
MRRGDIVQLGQLIQIHATQPEEFTHGIIAARIKSKAENTSADSSAPKSTVKELIVYLYNPVTAKICLDEDGLPILFDVQSSEVTLFKSVKKHSNEIQED